MRNQTVKLKKSAAQGEINAIAGYKAQYDAAVYHTLRYLRDQNLKEVDLANIDAGQVDDLVLVLRSNAVHAYQVKDLEDVQSFNDFTRTGGLLGQLAAGWQKLQAVYVGKQVHIHLVTNQAFSESTHANVILPFGTIKPQNPHFKGFWEDIWQPYQAALQNNVTFGIPQEWQPAFSSWKTASGLSDSQFEEFARVFSRDPIPTKAQVLQYAEVDHLKNLYYEYQERVAEAKRTNKRARFSSGEIVALLGLQFSLMNTHDFHVSALYRPIQNTVDALVHALTTFKQGYVCVIGSPGSGKSSLLTRTLVEAERDERIIRYYCFIPNEGYGAPPREEATSFLNDLVVQLETEGFQAGTQPPVPELDKLRARFGQQLTALGEHYQKYGTKTIILIDGLDYVTLEERRDITHPLVECLPAPNQIPEGVLIVLGTQHINDVPTSVQEHFYNEPERRIEMQQLTAHDVGGIIQESGMWSKLSGPGRWYDDDPASKRANTIHQLSEGHPLALEYVLSRLSDAFEEGVDVDSTLDVIIPHHGNIYDQYSQYWRQIDAGESSGYANLAGLLARMRGGLDFVWMYTWGDLIVRKFHNRFHHYFRPGWDGRHYFFHDSFRRFLRARSMETPEGNLSELDQAYHRQLAARCSQGAEVSSHHWDTIYHCWQASDYQSVCSLLRPDYFQLQQEKLRPIQDIASDLTLVAKAAAYLNDPVLLFRALLLSSEYEQRFWNLSEVEDQLLELLIANGNVQTALSWSMLGEHLRSGRFSDNSERSIQALELCRQLAPSSPMQAREVFNLVEPIHLLRRSKPFTEMSGQHTDDILNAWAEAVAYFRPVQEVIAQIRELHWGDDLHRNSFCGGEQFTHLRQATLISHVRNSLLAQKRWDDLEMLMPVAPITPNERLSLLACLMNAYEQARWSGDDERAMRYMERMRTSFPPEELLHDSEVWQQELRAI